MLCNANLRSITWSHLQVSHGISTDDYKLMFPGQSLSSDKQRVLAAERWKALHKDPVFMEEHADRARLQLARLRSNKDWWDEQNRKASERLKALSRDKDFIASRDSSTRESLRSRWRADPEGMMDLITGYRGGGIGIRTPFNGVTYKSKAEARFAKALTERHVKFEYEPLSFDYVFEDDIRTYIPDFFLTESLTLVEVKLGRMRLNPVLQYKLTSVREFGFDIIVIGSKGIKHFQETGELSDQDSYVNTR